MTGNGDLTVQDLPPRERVKAYLPATGAVLGIVALVLIVAFAYSAHQADITQRKANRDTAELARLSYTRFQYATNRSVCGFRAIADAGIATARQVIARSKAALADPTTTASAKARNQKAEDDASVQITQARAFKATQVTVPYDYDCRLLPKRPPREVLRP